jgi:hypothetical protein
MPFKRKVNSLSFAARVERLELLFLPILCADGKREQIARGGQRLSIA